jgi:DNA-binding winged helix-turn-helix (wHTH) protein
MKNPAPPRCCIRFGTFEFNPQAAELRKQGLKIKLWPQAAKILWLLLEHPGKVRTREELQRRLWPNNVFVDFERSLNKTIHALREALGDSAVNPRYIETLFGEGYRFIPIPQERRTFPVKSRNARKIDSLAVLPFVNESADPELEFLNRSVVERVIDDVSRVPGLRVLAYGTVQHYRDGDLVPTRVGQDLLVRAVAAGEIFQRSDNLLLHLELIDVGDGTQLWGAQFDGSFAVALSCPEKLANNICDQLRPILASAASSAKEERRERVA